MLQFGGFVLLTRRKEKIIFFCLLQTMPLVLRLPGCFETKLNLLYCILEMHFKYLFKGDSYILGCRREGNIISRALRKGVFWPVSSSPYY